MRRLSGLYLHSNGRSQRFVIHFAYDAAHRKETSRTILPSGVETHRRILLGPRDVVAASEGTGLEVEDSSQVP